MYKLKLTYFLLFFFLSIQTFADDFDEFMDGPEPPPDSVSIHNPYLSIALFGLIFLLIFLKLKNKSKLF